MTQSNKNKAIYGVVVLHTRCVAIALTLDIKKNKQVETSNANAIAHLFRKRQIRKTIQIFSINANFKHSFA